MLNRLLEGLSGAVQELLAAGTQSDRIPGSSVTPARLKTVLTKTSLINWQLGTVSSIHADELRKLIPKVIEVDPVSEAIRHLDVLAIIEALNDAKKSAATLAQQFPQSASVLGKVQAEVDQAVEEWKAIADADFGNEEVAFDFNISFRGPKSSCERVRAAVQRAADDAIIQELIGFRLGIAPKCGHLLVLDPKDPQHLECISITGDELIKRVLDLGGKIVSAEELKEFEASLDDSDDADDDGLEDDDSDDDCNDDDES